MSDRTRRTAWEGIKSNLKKPFVRKRENESQWEGKKLMITALISIETCKSTVLLKAKMLATFQRLVCQLSSIMPRRWGGGYCHLWAR